MDCFCKKKNILKSSKILSNEEKLARIRQMKNDKNVTKHTMIRFNETKNKNRPLQYTIRV